MAAKAIGQGLRRKVRGGGNQKQKRKSKDMTKRKGIKGVSEV